MELKYNCQNYQICSLMHFGKTFRAVTPRIPSGTPLGEIELSPPLLLIADDRPPITVQGRAADVANVIVKQVRAVFGEHKKKNCDNKRVSNFLFA